MADYNIFIHSLTNYESPTTPVQLRENADISGVGGEGGEGGSGFGFVRRTAAFLTNPDSLIGEVQSTASGVISKIAPIAALVAVIGIGKKVVDLYVPYSSNASGNYDFQIKYNNFNQVLRNITHPFGTAIQRQIAMLDMKKENAKNEQERLLFGGTIYDSKYGRYL